MIHAGTVLLALPLMSEAANYSTQQLRVDGVEIVRLTDSAHKTEVSIVPSVGNLAYEMKVNGKNALWNPFASVAELKAKPALCGVPFLAPWANRLDRYGFWANGKDYKLNAELKNLRQDQFHNPIHGLLFFSPLWKVVEAKSDRASAHVTSRLEFWRYPDLMAQFPFAHSIEMTYRLAEGVLQVETVLHNLSTEAMPVLIGFHPYFTLHDAPRDQWKAHLAAREHLALTDKLLATGEHNKSELPDPFPLAGHQLDDGFVDLIRGDDGRAEFWVQGKSEKISVLYGPKYTVAVSYAPPGKDFICFEPMTSITNGVNLAHEGKYPAMQSVAAGSEWRESFWIKPTGF